LLFSALLANGPAGHGTCPTKTTEVVNTWPRTSRSPPNRASDYIARRVHHGNPGVAAKNRGPAVHGQVSRAEVMGTMFKRLISPRGPAGLIPAKNVHGGYGGGSPPAHACRGSFDADVAAPAKNGPGRTFSACSSRQRSTSGAGRDSSRGPARPPLRLRAAAGGHRRINLHHAQAQGTKAGASA